MRKIMKITQNMATTNIYHTANGSSYVLLCKGVIDNKFRYAMIKCADKIGHELCLILIIFRDTKKDGVLVRYSPTLDKITMIKHIDRVSMNDDNIAFTDIPVNDTYYIETEKGGKISITKDCILAVMDKLSVPPYYVDIFDEVELDEMFDDLPENGDIFTYRYLVMQNKCVIDREMYDRYLQLYVKITVYNKKMLIDFSEIYKDTEALTYQLAGLDIYDGRTLRFFVDYIDNESAHIDVYGWKWVNGNARITPEDFSLSSEMSYNKGDIDINNFKYHMNFNLMNWIEQWVEGINTSDWFWKDYDKIEYMFD